MSRFLTVEEVLDFHDMLEPTAALLDRGKLEGAVMRPQASYDGKFLHASIYKQSSVLMHGICGAHAFLDGNKRTAWVSSVVFLSLNGITLVPISPADMSDYVAEVAQRVHTEEDTAFWLAALDSNNHHNL